MRPEGENNMKLLIDHMYCKHGGAFFYMCLLKTMLYPLGHGRSCPADVEDDSQEELTVTSRDEGGERTLVIAGEEAIRAAAFEGWVAFEREKADS